MWTHRNAHGLTVTPGFLLLAGLMLYLDDGTGALLWAVLAAITHELGHIAASLALHGRVSALTLSGVGAELRFSYPAPLSYGRENVVALAGPAANLLLGIPAMWLGAYFPAAVCLGLGVFNLLPILPLDGGRVLFNLVSERFGPTAAERVLAVSAGVTIGFLAGFGAVAAVKFANIIPLLLTLWLLLSAMQRGEGEKPEKHRKISHRK